MIDARLALSNSDRVNDDPSIPEIPRDQATDRVARAGAAAAEAAGLTCVVELSPGSESTYLHTLRGGTWYGVRVSCHEPAYDCSKDYEQVRLPEPLTDESLAEVIATLGQRVVHGGDVVADPAEVAVAVEKIAAVMADGRVYRDTDGTNWRWSADDEAWDVRGRFWGDAEPTPPTHRPHASVSSRIRCQVRHSHNANAKWAAEGGGSEA